MGATSFLIALLGIAVAGVGALLLTRTLKRQLRDEVGHAAEVLAQLDPEPEQTKPSERAKSAGDEGVDPTNPPEEVEEADPADEAEPSEGDHNGHEDREAHEAEENSPTGPPGAWGGPSQGAAAQGGAGAWPSQGGGSQYPAGAWYSQSESSAWTSRAPANPWYPPPPEFAELARTSRQEAEIYLRHHELALEHHATYQQASLWAGVLGFAIVLVGGVLTYVAGLDVGVVTALAGALPAVAAGLLFRQANLVADRAAENLRGLETSVRRFNSLQAAKDVADQIADIPTRTRMYELIGQRLLADQAP